MELCTTISKERRTCAQKHYVKCELLPRMQMQIDVSYKHPAGEPMERIYQAYCRRSETDQIT